MPDVSTPEPQVEPSAASVNNVSGVNLHAQRDVTSGYTVEQVSNLLTRISSAFQPKPFDGRCPYLGLNYFCEGYADRFFGRETFLSELIERVKEPCCLVMAGPSCSGKSMS